MVAWVALILALVAILLALWAVDLYLHATQDDADLWRRLSRLEAQEKHARHDADKSAATWKADYEMACATIAAMHEAAMGAVVGPRRGVVEDIADLRAEVLRHRDRRLS